MSEPMSAARFADPPREPRAPKPARTYSQVRPTTLNEVKNLGAIPLVHASKPNAAGLLNIGRAAAYHLAATGDLPTLRLGQKWLVPVPTLLRMLDGR